MTVQVVFRSVLREDAQPEYGQTMERMDEIVSSMPGYLESYSVRDPDSREGITVVRFADEESLAAWRNHVEHLEAQETGRLRFYEWYDLSVAHEVRHTDWQRKS
jgi:heme-degrading monooxygenase HmoA